MTREELHDSNVETADLREKEFSPETDFPGSSKKEKRLDLIAKLRSQISEVLNPLIGQGAKCALLDYPNHANVGDNAIWLGEFEYLRSRGVDLVCAWDIINYSQKHFQKKLSDGIILLHGGGNLGDIWPRHQLFREKVLLDFPDHKIIQMPQTICFQNMENLKRAQRIFNQHLNFTLLVRDQKSFEFAKNEFKIPIFLCPDMAFALGPLTSFGSSSEKKLGVTAFLRGDAEAPESFEFLKEDGISKIEWVTRHPALPYVANRRILALVTEFPNRLRWLGLLQSFFYRRLAEGRFRRGIRKLNRAKVSVSNFLHVHILSLLLGIPHVGLDNSYGKVKNFFDTWFKNSELSFWADSYEEAIQIAKRLAQRKDLK